MEGTLIRWDPRIVMNAESLKGLDKPVVYLVGSYEQREDWLEIDGALRACHARCYPG